MLVFLEIIVFALKSYEVICVYESETNFSSFYGNLQVYGGHVERVNFLKGSARVVTYAIIR